jgi:oligosaccharyltransferase complex subunit alpha (ribophorin I)
MDTIGRTTLTLSAINIVDDLRDRELVVTYDYAFTAGLRKPFVIAGGVLSLFITAWIVGSVDVGIRAKKS